MVIMQVRRNGYSPQQCGKTMTVGELLELLEGFDEEEKIYTSHDNGYTFGEVCERDFDSQDEEDDSEGGEE